MELQVLLARVCAVAARGAPAAVSAPHKGLEKREEGGRVTALPKNAAKLRRAGLVSAPAPAAPAFRLGTASVVPE